MEGWLFGISGFVLVSRTKHSLGSGGERTKAERRCCECSFQVWCCFLHSICGCSSGDVVSVVVLLRKGSDIQVAGWKITDYHERVLPRMFAGIELI